jgi:hypothetical protein
MAFHPGHLAHEPKPTILAKQKVLSIACFVLYIAFKGETAQRQEG